jgi:hypothetical protein
MVYLRTKFRMPWSYGSLVITVIQKVRYRFYAAIICCSTFLEDLLTLANIRCRTSRLLVWYLNT